MRRFVLIAAIFAALSAPAFAQEEYTGRIVSTAFMRHSTVVVQRGDTVWKLCKRYQWCRYNYAGPIGNSEAIDFESRVQDLNPGININRLLPGQVVNLPLPTGTAEALEKEDRMIAGLQSKAKKLADENAGLTADKTSLTVKVSEQEGIISSLKALLNSLSARLDEEVGKNKELTKTVSEQSGQIAKLGEENQQYSYWNRILIIISVVAGIIGCMGLVFAAQLFNRAPRFARVVSTEEHIAPQPNINAKAA